MAANKLLPTAEKNGLSLHQGSTSIEAIRAAIGSLNRPPDPMAQQLLERSRRNPASSPDVLKVARRPCGLIERPLFGSTGEACQFDAVRVLQQPNMAMLLSGVAGP